MKNLSIAPVLLLLLAACGGGGNESSSTAGQSVSSTVAVPPAATSAASTSEQIVAAPTPPGSAVQMTAGGFNQGSNAMNVVVSFTGATDLTLSGRLNGIWLSAAQAGGGATVSGDLNTIVFKPGVDTTLTVTGSGNTFYLPVGSPIKLEGSGLASSTIRYYKS